jgi:hypothetical protein
MSGQRIWQAIRRNGRGEEIAHGLGHRRDFSWRRKKVTWPDRWGLHVSEIE